MKLDDGVDLGGVERALRRLGYDAPPGGSGTGGTWVGTRSWWPSSTAT